MFCNSDDENEITHICLMENEGVENGDTSDNDNDDDTCTSNYEEEKEEIEYDIPNDLYDFLSNYFKRKLIKVLLHYIRCQEGYISKIKDLKKINFELSQQNIEFRKSNDLKSFQEKFILLEKEKDELQIKCVNLEKIILKFSKEEDNLNKILDTQKVSFNKEGNFKALKIRQKQRLFFMI